MLYRQLADFTSRPEAFSRYTIDKLWTDPHISRQMLAFHLDADHDAASRRATTIDGTVRWFDRRFGLRGKRVLDLGCGPGLYATRMAALGASVIGLDFSPTSIAHAVAQIPAGFDLHYTEGNYLTDPLPAPADIVTLIYSDYCTLSPNRRRTLLNQISRVLAPGGRFVFDVDSPGQLFRLREGIEFGHRFMSGFWAAEDYFAFKSTFLYPESLVSLERYLVVSEQREFEVFNWMQYFTPASVTAELAESGYAVEAAVTVRSGRPWVKSATPFFVISHRA